MTAVPPLDSAPLARSYPSKVALVLLALCPYIVVTTAVDLMQKPLLHDLHTDKVGLQLASGIANAAYAFGAVLAAALIKKLRLRGLFLALEAVFLAGSVIVATAGGLDLFVLGRSLQGFATGLLLVVALPPLVTSFGVAELPVTVGVVDIGLFGATTLGPLLGGWVGAHDAWRLLFWVLAAVAGARLLTGVLSLPNDPPFAPDAEIDTTAIWLAALATALPFYASSELAAHPVVSWEVLPALLVGVAALITLIVSQYRRENPLTPVRLVAHTLPVTGIIAAMGTGATAVTVLELAENILVQGRHEPVVHVGELFWPQLVGVAVAAVAFGKLLRTAHLRALVVVGTLALAGSALGLAFVSARTGHLTFLLVSLGIGFGAGATVAPALFLAGLSCPSKQLGPTFALVELLRSEAAFLVGPVLLHVAQSQGTSPRALDAGTSTAAWATLAIVLGGSLLSAVLWRAGGASDQPPQLERWLDDGDEAFDSPPIAARWRHLDPAPA
ncbi:MAG TPA: MFS transporter [Acidimicrobiales bacterium]|nr:MFS transporter [Acidimicrobiales bacterium]